jgi:hypothetical protein
LNFTFSSSCWGVKNKPWKSSLINDINETS